ncbi:MAG TPA: hypothetical protein VEC16_06155 [Alphaproteobacteria bacterium]|nr:hypothetical protein [Alphaproteobacteria bacterium]
MNSMEEDTKNFALLIRQSKDAKGIKYEIRSENQGISDTEIILIVESWLEKVRENFKSNIKSGIQFHKK